MKYLLVVLAVISSFFVAPPASASGCPATELVFARGTSESPGLGEVGDAFAAALNIPVYAVDYPASMDFQASTLAGVTDAAQHIESLVARCRNVRVVLGGYSAGAAVAAFTTNDAPPPGVDTELKPLSDDVANHVRAVVVFGLPTAQFTGMLGVAPAVIGPRFASKSREFCVEADPVCSSGSDWALHSAYSTNGMTLDAANFVRNHL